MRSIKSRPGWAILAAALLALALKVFVLDAAIVDGRSMLPTLRPGSLVLVLRCAYGLRSPSGSGYLFGWASPRRGDIVSAFNPRDGLPIVKRVAAAGPARLTTAAGRLLGPGLDASLSGEEEARIGSGLELGGRSYFLLGDNPPESLDSRDYGPVPLAAISGRVMLLAGRAR
jgi:signal peptidase I